MNWNLYIGQKIKTDSTLCIKGVDVITGITSPSKNKIMLHCKNGVYDTTISNCKPVLRSLDQMTDEEKKEYDAKFPVEKYDHDNKFPFLPLAIDWLTSKGFAIRGEIENGTAIKEEL